LNRSWYLVLRERLNLVVGPSPVRASESRAAHIYRSSRQLVQSDLAAGAAQPCDARYRVVSRPDAHAAAWAASQRGGGVGCAGGRLTRIPHGSTAPRQKRTRGRHVLSIRER